MPIINSDTASERLLKSNHKGARGELGGRLIVTLCALIMIVATVSIASFLTIKGLQSFVVDSVDPFEFLTGTDWNPTNADNPKYGAFPFIFGSLAVTCLSALIATPLGIGGAIFMTEIAPSWGKKILQPVIELLVGIPSVVYGFIGLPVVVPTIRNVFDGASARFSLLAGTTVLSVLMLPTITTIATEAMGELRSDLREGSYGLGATRWQTIRRVLTPAALPSLM